MDIKVKRELLMSPTKNPWEARAVLNPSVVQDKDGTEHIFYRAVAMNGISSIGYARIKNGKLERFDKPLIRPTKSYEIKGVEDPRVTKIGNIYYMLYVAFDGSDAKVAYAISKDLKKWEKKGVISPNILVKEARNLVKFKKYRDNWKNQEISGPRVALWDKDAVLFPKKIKGKFVMLHRFLPDIQIVKFKKFSDLKKDSFWRNYIVNLSEGRDDISLYQRYSWEGEHIGAGAIPIETKKGWLIIYHGVSSSMKESVPNIISRVLHWFYGTFHQLRKKKRHLIYHVGAALLDLKKPEIEITRLKEPLFSPSYPWEKTGDVNNVVFPEGISVRGDKLKIYYGCADTQIGVAEVSLKGLLKSLK
ncbi:MAG: pesticidal protein Cry7Aa [Nanoarchaeota archaeon]|nr:pesticidal protein Cry7Aa [Nanoarchaeota archaeon]